MRVERFDSSSGHLRLPRRNFFLFGFSSLPPSLSSFPLRFQNPQAAVRPSSKLEMPLFGPWKGHPLGTVRQ
ncbi:hypothetical protein B0H12DRAFT_1143247 [Mycena haematopus]|nr:hypothetical protein B0H12DRAFT_1143247 [Mycena haematopus]